jgi:hypothetical protein
MSHTIISPTFVQYIDAYYNKRLLFYSWFLAIALGLRRATTLAVLTLSLQRFVVFRTALRSYPPAFPPKLDGGGILLVCQILGAKLPGYYALVVEPYRQWSGRRVSLNAPVDHLRLDDIPYQTIDAAKLLFIASIKHSLNFLSQQSRIKVLAIEQHEFTDRNA